MCQGHCASFHVHAYRLPIDPHQLVAYRMRHIAHVDEWISSFLCCRLQLIVHLLDIHVEGREHGDTGTRHGCGRGHVGGHEHGGCSAHLPATDSLERVAGQACPFHRNEYVSR